MTCQWLKKTESMTQKMITWTLTSDFLERNASISWGRASVTLFSVDRNAIQKIWGCTGNNFLFGCHTENIQVCESIDGSSNAITAWSTMFETSITSILSARCSDTFPFNNDVLTIRWLKPVSTLPRDLYIIEGLKLQHCIMYSKSNVTIPHEQDSC